MQPLRLRVPSQSPDRGGGGGGGGKIQDKERVQGGMKKCRNLTNALVSVQKYKVRYVPMTSDQGDGIHSLISHDANRSDQWLYFADPAYLASRGKDAYAALIYTLS